MLFAAWLGSNTSLVKIDARIIRACLSVVCFSGQAFPSPLPGWNTDAFLQHAQLYQDPKLILIEMSETGASPLLRRWGLEFFSAAATSFPWVYCSCTCTSVSASATLLLLSVSDPSSPWASSRDRHPAPQGVLGCAYVSPSTQLENTHSHFSPECLLCRGPSPS